MAGKPGRSGRRRLPDELRTGHRTYPPSPQPSDEPIEKPPMSADALIVWDRILPKIQDLGVMTWVDSEALAVLCELLALHHKSPNPKTAGACMNFLGHFGLTPATRPKLVAGSNPAAPADEFDDF